MSIIELKNITKSYGNKKVLNKLSLEINECEMIAITGASGKGKTTILNIIGLLEKIDDGKLIIDGDSNIKVNSSKATKILRYKISYLFQNFALVDNETVLYNLNLALKYVRIKKNKKLELIGKVLNDVGLPGIEHSKIFELSGGQQQRVAIARIMLKPCKIVLADEPTGSLDDENSNNILKLLKLLKSKGKTIVIVTHNKSIANQCDRTVQI